MNFVSGREHIADWVTDKSGGNLTDYYECVAVADDEGNLKAGVVFDGWTGEGGSVFLHSRIDDAKYATRAFYCMVFAYAYMELDVKMCYGIVNSYNEKAKKLNEKLGFTKEHPLRNYFPDGDAILYGLHRDDCRWIRKDHEIRPFKHAA
jgi:RimJ/RimL family protein N-acetyltransferase